jgi:hypothetical protein
MQSEIRVDSDEMSVEGRMMDFRERDAVADHRLTEHLVLIFDDMSGVEKHGLGEPGQSTSASVGANNSFSKGRLMETLFDGSQRVSTLNFRRGWRLVGLAWQTERNAGALRGPIPSPDEGWKDGLLASRRDSEKVDDWDLILEGLSKPTIICRVRIVAHESVVHHLIAVENLAVDITLVIIPHAVACLRKDRVDRQQESHLRRLEDSAPWIDQRVSLAVDNKAFTKLLGSQMVVDFAESSYPLECGRAQKSVAN